MKYKRQLMGSIIAIAILVGNYPSFENEDFVPISKVGQYMNQVKMKSGSDEDKVDVKNKKTVTEEK